MGGYNCARHCSRLFIEITSSNSLNNLARGYAILPFHMWGNWLSQDCSLLATEPEFRLKSIWLPCFLAVFLTFGLFVIMNYQIIYNIHITIQYWEIWFCVWIKKKNPAVKRDFNGSAVSISTKIIENWQRSVFFFLKNTFGNMYSKICLGVFSCFENCVNSHCDNWPCGELGTHSWLAVLVWFRDCKQGALIFQNN